ncbi:hypothetical protein JY96_16080 [Aquabacterium sp. NJ1]|uniref:glycosyltransferase family 2 protein n=1 Tax=Aquabacterium sp. NJ1 TaxID=1538295 RepID=UPI00052D6D01|nr:glycosyltransferase family 2 protein [Aquabacterium sp. NJ1]KGM41055.1 hypothetical protein JY96_16080 [Aquabacterium sp. NJ1]
MLSIGVVVLNFRSHAKVERLLASIDSFEDICVCIVDNSVDSVELAALHELAHRYPAVEVLDTGRNGGFSFGTNAGIRHLLDRCTSVLILNPDTTLERDFFSRLKALHTGLPDVAISPHGIRMSDGSVWSAGGEFYWLKGRADVLPHARRSVCTPFGTCACLLVPSDAIRDVGLLDEDFFLGGEEWDLSRRLTRSGWSIVYARAVRYQHEVSGTHEKYGHKFFYMGMRTKVLFARKHYGLWFWGWLVVCFLPAVPMLLLRHTRINKTGPLALMRSIVTAAWRSARAATITETEFLSAGRTR